VDAISETVAIADFDIDEDGVYPRRNRWNLDRYWLCEPQLGIEYTLETTPVVDCARIQWGLWNVSLFYNHTPHVASDADMTTTPTLDAIVRRDGVWNTTLYFNQEPRNMYGAEFEYGLPDVTTGWFITARDTLRVDRDDITVADGAPDNPAIFEAASIQEPADITLEEI